MRDRATIALACVLPAERTSIMEWLWQSGYEAITLSDLSRLDDDLQAHSVEALVADASASGAGATWPH